MPRSAYKKVFRDREKLKEALTMRKAGMSLPAIAEHFGVDHSSVLTQCVRHNVTPHMEGEIVLAEEEKPLTQTYALRRQREYRRGIKKVRNYREYLKESLEREPEVYAKLGITMRNARKREVL